MCPLFNVVIQWSSLYNRLTGHAINRIGLHRLADAVNRLCYLFELIEGLVHKRTITMFGAHYLQEHHEIYNA